MKWFKHLSGSHKDSIIFEAIEKFGGDGYLVFFGILEMMADEFDIHQPETVTISIKKLTNFFQISRKKLTKILDFFDKKSQEFNGNKSFFVEFNENHVKIICKRFAELADNHTAHELKKTSKSLQSHFETTSPQDIKIKKDKEDNTDKESLISSNEDIIPEGSGDAPSDGNKPERKIPTCPHKEIVNIYHETLPSLTTVKEWTDQRQELLRTRWKEKPERQTVEWWKSFFEFVSKSDFLMGRVNKFKADLEWLVHPKNFVRVIEGKYHDRNGANPLMSKSSEGIMGWAARERARMAQTMGTQKTQEAQHDD
jgi:hypothetical protein